MAEIHLTDNTTLTLTGSSADNNATLKRYLTESCRFITPEGFAALARQSVETVEPAAFPCQCSATGAGKFTLEGTTLTAKGGVSAKIGVAKGAGMEGSLKALDLKAGADDAALVTFKLGATFSAADAIKAGRFGFGLSSGAGVVLGSSVLAAAGEPFGKAVERALCALTIPHDIDDLRSLPEHAICEMETDGSVGFKASVSYSVLNTPLVQGTLPSGMAVSFEASAGVSFEVDATHKASHTLTVAKTASDCVHLGLNLTRTDDLDASLEATAGLTGKFGGVDGLAAVLGWLGVNSTTERDRIRKEFGAERGAALASDIKNAIDTTVANSLQASMKAELDRGEQRQQVFLYEIKLNELDQDGTRALESALKGDFRALTSVAKSLAGIRRLRSVLTKVDTATRSLVLHLFGVFNWGDINSFNKTQVTTDGGETRKVTLSDQSTEVFTSSLRGEKLRKVVLKGITLTQADAEPAPVQMVFYHRQADPSPAVKRQLVNILSWVPNALAPEAARALLTEPADAGAIWSLYLGLELNPEQYRGLFLGAGGQARDWTFYIETVCHTQRQLLASATEGIERERLKLYQQDVACWRRLRDAGSDPEMFNVLNQKGIRLLSTTDVVATNWWAAAMEAYAQAVARTDSLERAGECVVKDSTGGFSEPWLILTAWQTLGSPRITCRFTKGQAAKA
jgi:hypothetical protein